MDPGDAECLEKLKETLLSSLVFIYLDLSKPSILDGDASDEGVGDVLSQECAGAVCCHHH